MFRIKNSSLGQSPNPSRSTSTLGTRLGQVGKETILIPQALSRAIILSSKG